MPPAETIRALADGRCFCPRCEDIYRMVGTCLKCGVTAWMLYCAGDETAMLTCPRCNARLATADEIPATVDDAAG
jgi:uncharacterized protein YbaR (Trm112 family)